jgi:multidrug efflux pump
MNISQPFILRPIATSLMMVALLFFGILTYKMLPVSALPEVNYPTIRVSTFYPGASPDVMASLVTAPLERQFGQMMGLSQMTSNSAMGCSIIILKFGLSMNLDVAEQEVQAAINVASSYLPNDLPNPPIYNKVNPADTPILTLAISSETMSLPKIEDLVDTRFSQKLAQISGVGLVSISGGQKPAIRIQVNPITLSAYGLTLEILRNALVASSVSQPKGTFEGLHQSFVINSNDQLLSAEDFKTQIISYNNGAPIRLSDVAEVIELTEDVRLAAWMNDIPSIIVNIQRQPGANVIEVVDRIKELLPNLTASLPAGIDVKILADRTISIRASVEEAEFDLLIAISLVVILIFLFLGSFTATIIPSIAVPLSLIGTFSTMYLLGFSINNLTLMALTIATGFVVDDAIVMIENIARYIEDGHKPLQAALKGSKQIGFTIISLTISLIATLIPLLFMGDIVGRLFREFAMTLSITILLSAFISLTLTPMMCAKFLKEHKDHKMNQFEKKTNDFIHKMIYYYGVSLRKVLAHQPFILITFLITMALSLYLFYVIPKGFFPIQDTGIIQAISEAPQSISFNAMAERQQALAKVILEDTDVENLSSFIGVDGNNTTLNSGRILINLKPIEDRKARVVEIIDRIEKNVEKVTGINLFLQAVQDFNVDDRISRTQYQFSLNGPDEKEVEHWSTELMHYLQKDGRLDDLATDHQNKGFKTLITIDRDSASRLGITPLQIDNALYSAFGQRQIMTLYTQVNQYHVILEVAPKFQHIQHALDSIYLNSTSGKPVPLSSITKVSTTNGPLLINRQSQFPVILISFNLKAGGSLGDAIDIIDKAKEDLQMPDTIRTQFEGAAKVFQSSLANEFWLVLGAIFVIYIVLGILYESYIHPITILSTLPSAGVGALCALFITDNDLSVIALIGIILLIGIVKKNAIMMIDFALDLERNQHKRPEDAIYEAALLRFRPILMTTLAALLGGVPLALSSGMGAELRQPLGITIIGGLILSQILTLYSTPVIYLFFDSVSRKVKKISKSKSKQKKPQYQG